MRQSRKAVTWLIWVSLLVCMTGGDRDRALQLIVRRTQLTLYWTRLQTNTLCYTILHTMMKGDRVLLSDYCLGNAQIWTAGHVLVEKWLLAKACVICFNQTSKQKYCCNTEWLSLSYAWVCIGVDHPLHLSWSRGRVCRRDLQASQGHMGSLSMPVVSRPVRWDRDLQPKHVWSDQPTRPLSDLQSMSSVM